MHFYSLRRSPRLGCARVIIVVINGHGGHQETINTATRRWQQSGGLWATGDSGQDDTEWVLCFMCEILIITIRRLNLWFCGQDDDRGTMQFSIIFRTCLSSNNTSGVAFCRHAHGWKVLTVQIIGKYADALAILSGKFYALLYWLKIPMHVVRLLPDVKA